MMRTLLRGIGIGLAAMLIVGVAIGTAADKPSGSYHVAPEAAAQTPPTTHAGDSADDPAFWIHPTDPAKSLIIGTDKQGGIMVYDPDGKLLQTLAEGTHPNNVDVLYGLPLGNRKVDIALAGCQTEKAMGLKFWTIDPASRKLTDATANNAIPLFGRHTPYGAGGYHSHKTGKFYAFVNNREGAQEQYEIIDAGGGKIGAKKVRAWKLPTMTEAIVADDELGVVYICEEKVGIWKFDAEPTGSTQGKLIAKAGEHALTPDIEGLAIYYGSGGKGYLIVSSQGNNTFKIYDRQGDNAYVGTIDPKAGAIDDVNDTDGIAVTNSPMTSKFSKGCFCVQDGSTPGKNQNFKMYRWEDIAGDKLIVDTTRDPRK
jgi:3-phytase